MRRLACCAVAMNAYHPKRTGVHTSISIGMSMVYSCIPA